MRTTDKSRNSAMLEMYAAGDSYAAIEERFGLSRRQVRRAIVEAGERRYGPERWAEREWRKEHLRMLGKW